MKLELILAVFFSQLFVAISIDPISTTVAIGASVFKKAENWFCTSGLRECCDSNWIKDDLKGLKKDLETKLHGQHLVGPIVTRAIKAHITDEDPQKPLVMSFHGWTGGGKSFVSNMIMDNLYRLGDKSRFVHYFHCELHFKHDNEVAKYKNQLHSWLHHNVSKCERSLFIFDDMDNMPVGVLDVLTPFLGHHKQIDGVDYRKAIFIFISNTDGNVITKIAHQQWLQKKKREDLALHDFEKKLEISAYNMLGGLKGSSLIERHLIDHFIPFLPLERRHVKKCVEDEFRRVRKFSYDEPLLEKVLDEMNWSAEDKIYSTSGCTKVSQKARLVDEL